MKIITDGKEEVISPLNGILNINKELREYEKDIPIYSNLNN